METSAAEVVEGRPVTEETQVQRTIPVCIVTRQARDFQSEHKADAAQSDFTDHAGEAGAVGHTGAGDPEIFIDDGDLLGRPPQFTSPLHEGVLAGGGLAIVLHLRR